MTEKLRDMSKPIIGMPHRISKITPREAVSLFEQIGKMFFYNLLGFLAVLRWHSIYSVFCFIFVTFVPRQKKEGRK